MQTLSWMLQAVVCGAIALNVVLFEPGMIHDEQIKMASEKPSPQKIVCLCGSGHETLQAKVGAVETHRL